MVLEIRCLGDAVCCQDLNQLSVTSATSVGSTLSPGSEHGLHSLAFGPHSDGSESDASIDEALAWPAATAGDGGAPLDDEEPEWPIAMAEGDDGYDPRDARFVREASDGSIAERARQILGGQIARLDAALRLRRARGEPPSALAHYGAVLRELRGEAAAAEAAAAAAAAAAPRVLAPLPRAPWVARGALGSPLGDGLLEEALFGGNSPRSASPLQRCRCLRRPSRSRSPARHGARGLEADDYDVIGGSCYA